MNNCPSNSDIQKEIRRTQANLRGALSAAKGISAILKVATGKEGKKIQFCNSEVEFGKFKNIKSQKRHDTPIQNDSDVHLASQMHGIQEPGGVSQNMAKDNSVVLTNQADMSNYSLNCEQCNIDTPVPSNICTNQLHESQSHKDHSQLYSCNCGQCHQNMISQVKRRERKLGSDDSAAFRNTDTKVLKSTSQNDDNSSHHISVCNCGKEKEHIDSCNLAVINLKASFSSEENLGNMKPQPGSRLVVQALPSLTIKRDLSVQKVPSVQIPPPGASPYMPPQQNVILCKMSHNQIQLDQQDCTPETSDNKKSTDKKVSKAKPKLKDGSRQYVHHEHTASSTLQDKTRKHTRQKHRSYGRSCASSGLGKTHRMTEEGTHHDSILQTKPAVYLGSGKCKECKGNFLTNEIKSGYCITCYGRSHNVLNLSTKSGLYQRKLHIPLGGSLMKQPSPKQYESWCRRCGNNFPLRDLSYEVCGRCHNIPFPYYKAKQHKGNSATDVVEAAAHLNQCSTCQKYFPKSELFHGHCIQCQIMKKETRLFQCNICLNSVPCTEYVNGKCNYCHYKFKSDTQKDELHAYPVLQGPAMDRILNTVFDEPSFLFDINKAQDINRSPSTGENMSHQNKKENGHFFGAEKKETRPSYLAQDATMKIPGFTVNDKSRRSKGKKSKAYFATEEYLNDNENKSIKKSLEICKQNDRQTVEFQNAQSENLKLDDEHEVPAKTSGAYKHQAVPYFEEKERECLSLFLGIQNYDNEDASSDSNGSSQMEAQVACDNINNDDRGSAMDSNGYEQDMESRSKGTDTELEVSKDNGEYLRMYPAVPPNVKCGTKEKETQSQTAAVQTIEDLSKETPKRVFQDIRTNLLIMDNEKYYQLSTSNRGKSDPDKLSQSSNKTHKPGDETDESSSRIHSDKFDDTSESFSDTNIETENGSKNESLDHGNFPKTSLDKGRQPHKHSHHYHSENPVAPDEPQYSPSKSKTNATVSKEVDYSHKHTSYKRQKITKYHSGRAAEDIRRHSSLKYHQQCFDGNSRRKKPVQTQKFASVKENQQPSRVDAISKKSPACKNESKHDSSEEKQLEVMTT